MKKGDIILRIGFGLLFIWGGLEKFFEGFLGGVGLEKTAGGLASLGFGFLGDSGTYVLAFFLAATELIAGILIVLNKKLAIAGFYSAFIIFVALVTAYLGKSWMQSMIHLALIAGYLAIGFNGYEKKKWN